MVAEQFVSHTELEPRQKLPGADYPAMSFVFVCKLGNQLGGLEPIENFIDNVTQVVKPNSIA